MSDRVPRMTPAQELAAVKAELSLFTAGAAHDLQQPLRQIIAAAGRLSRTCARSVPTAARDVTRILELAQSMRRLVDYLVAYQQVSASALDLQPISATEAVGDVLVALEPKIAASRATVVLDKLPTIKADPIQLRQVLHHLLDNALKFHAPGKAPRVRLSGRRHAGGVELCVEDEGIGIEKRYLQTIFEPFRRLNCVEAYEGSGLGLAICRKIAERHGGRLEVRSRPGRGSRFYFWLPD